MSADSEREGGDAPPPEGANAWWVAVCCAGLAVASAAWYLQRESLHADVSASLTARLASQDEQLREQSWEIQMLQGAFEDLNSEFAARVAALERGEAARKSALQYALAKTRESAEAPAPLQTASTQASSAGSGEAPEAVAPRRKPGAGRDARPPEADGSREVAFATQTPPEAAPRSANRPSQSLPARVGPESARIQRIEEVIPVRSGGVLLPRGRLQLEPQMSFATSSVNRVEIMGYTILPALTLGVIDVTRRETTSLSGIMTARYGLTDRIEIDALIPTMASWSRFRLSPTNTDANRSSNISASGYGFGDLRIGARYQINRGDRSTPIFVGGLSARFPTGKSPYEIERHTADQQFLEKELPTGSGFYALSPTISFVYPNEPGVLFGNLRYTWNIPGVVHETQPGSTPEQDFGKIDPGDVIGGSMGLGLSINDRLSVALSYDHAYVLKTKQDGSYVTGSVPLQIGSFGAGITWRRNQRSSYSFFLGVGVTDDAPDVSLGIRIPTSYDLFRD